MSVLQQRIAEAVHDYLAQRLKSLGKSADTLTSSVDLFDDGVLDSVGLTGLIAAVERDTGRDIDFIDVDPDALGTISGIIEALSRAIEAR